MSQKKARYSYLQRAASNKENESQPIVCRTEQKKTYSDPMNGYKYGNGQRYKTGYHFKLKEALKENSRNIFYLRKVFNEKKQFNPSSQHLPPSEQMIQDLENSELIQTLYQTPYEND